MLQILSFVVGLGYALQGLHFWDPEVVNPMTDALVYDGETYFLYVRPARFFEETNKVRIYTSTDVTNWELGAELELPLPYLGLSVRYSEDMENIDYAELTGGGHIMIWVYSDPTESLFNAGVTTDPLDPSSWVFAPAGNYTKPVQRVWQTVNFLVATTPLDAALFFYYDSQPLVDLVAILDEGYGVLVSTEPEFLPINHCLAYDHQEYGDIMTHTSFTTLTLEDGFVWDRVIVVGVLHDPERLYPQGMLLIPEVWTMYGGEPLLAKKEFILPTPVCETLDLTDGTSVPLMCGGEHVPLFRVVIEESEMKAFTLHIGDNSEIKIVLFEAGLTLVYNGCEGTPVTPRPLVGLPAIPMKIDVVVDFNAIEILATFGDFPTQHIASLFACPAPSVMLEGTSGSLAVFGVPPHPCTDPQGLQMLLLCAVWEQVPWLGDMLLNVKIPFLLF